MPTYGYECTRCKEQFEVVQKITDDPLVTHEGCGGELRKLMYPVGIVFKGSGFYVNDYAKAKNGAATAGSKTLTETSTTGSTTPPKASETKTETKPQAKTAEAKKP